MALSSRAREFQNLLDRKNLGLTVQELPDLTRTAEEAADALDCSKAQIVKSLVFRDAEINEPIVILVSGVNRVDVKNVSQATGIQLAKADADFVKEKTGYSIGGVPPIGHKEAAMIIVDHDLLKFDEVWAAAGTPHAVFCIPGDVTQILPDCRVMEVGQ